MINVELFNVYQDRIGGSAMELQRLEFYVSGMHNLVICYFVFKNQSHYSGVRGQRITLKLVVNVSYVSALILKR